MRAVVTGGRHYGNWPVVRAALDALLIEAMGELEIAEGGATGADALARRWCRENGIEPRTYRARWRDVARDRVVVRYDRHGRPYNAAAGAVRNAEMLRHFRPDLVIALTGGAGTADCKRTAGALGIAVREIADTA